MTARRGQPHWIDVDDGFIGATWYWPVEVAACSTMVVIVPGIAHEERTMSGGVVALAEALADQGLPAMLIDLHGCSQSAGRLEDDNIAGRWQDDIQSAVRHARDCGAARVIVVGVRLGFLLVADALAGDPLAGLVAWAPIVSGRRHIRELKLLDCSNDAESMAAGTIAISGFSLPVSVLEHISRLDLAKIDIPRASHLLLCELPSGLNAPWLAPLRASGLAIEQQKSHQVYRWLFGATDQPELPHDDIAALARWCRARHDAVAKEGDLSSSRPALRPSIEFAHSGELVRETFVEIGPSGLTGVLSEPVGAQHGHAVRLLMSSVGPGRSFADFARDEASRGNVSLRFDFAGFGTSGRGNAVQGGELYSDEGARDVASAIAYLREAGQGEIYGLGFCAGAWSMMQSDAASSLCAAVAINVALYRQPGLKRRILGRAVLGQMSAAWMRRTAWKQREPVDWLVRLIRSKVHILLAYDANDPGLDYLKRQIAEGVVDLPAGHFTLETYPGLGHLANGSTARVQLFREITEYFARIDGELATLREQPRSTLKRRLTKKPPGPMAPERVANGGEAAPKTRARVGEAVVPQARRTATPKSGKTGI